MSFRNLDVSHQAAVLFLPLAVSIADSLSPRYVALGDQLRRASISIPLDITDGSGKSTRYDPRWYYAIARGSAMECAAILDACNALVLIENPKLVEADQILLSTVRMLSKMCVAQAS